MPEPSASSPREGPQRGLETSPFLFHFKKRLCQMVTHMIPRLAWWSLRFSRHTGAILKPRNWPHNGSCLGVRGQDSGNHLGKRVDGFQLLPLLGWNGATGIKAGNNCHPQVEDYQRGTMLRAFSQAPPRCQFCVSIS